jgi:hypothetical protein
VGVRAICSCGAVRKWKRTHSLHARMGTPTHRPPHTHTHTRPQGYPQCGTGSQSPINIVQAHVDARFAQPIQLSDTGKGCSTVNFTDTGHYWEVTTSG